MFSGTTFHTCWTSLARVIRWLLLLPQLVVHSLQRKQCYTVSIIILICRGVVTIFNEMFTMINVHLNNNQYHHYPPGEGGDLPGGWSNAQPTWHTRGSSNLLQVTILTAGRSSNTTKYFTKSNTSTLNVLLKRRRHEEVIKSDGKGDLFRHWPFFNKLIPQNVKGCWNPCVRQ